MILLICYSFMQVMPVQTAYGQVPVGSQDEPIFNPDDIIKQNELEKKFLARSNNLLNSINNSSLKNYFDPSSFETSNEYFRNAVHKLREGNTSEAQLLESKAIEAYHIAIVNDLNSGLLVNLTNQLYASEEYLGPVKLRQGIKMLESLSDDVNSYKSSSENFKEYSDKLLSGIDDLVKGLGLDSTGPSYLYMQDFVITVDKETKYEFDRKSGSLVATGSGRISFCCLYSCGDEIEPVISNDCTLIVPEMSLKKIDFNVVEIIADNAKQILLDDARLINPSVTIGGMIQLALIIKDENPIEIAIAKDHLFGKMRRIGENEIEVRFNKLPVMPVSENFGQVIGGDANYTAERLSEEHTLIDIGHGCKLAIKKLKLTTSSCIVKAKLLLHESLASGTNCTPAVLELGTFDLGRNCEFYQADTSGIYGPFEVGTTTLVISGKGYIIDFSSTIKYSEAQDDKWKGVILLKGSSKDPGGTVNVISNTGYLRASYTYQEAYVSEVGLESFLTCYTPFSYTTLQPSGFRINFNDAVVNLYGSEVSGGHLRNGEAEIPYNAARGKNNIKATIYFKDLTIHSGRNIFGKITNPEQLFWGELSKENKIYYSVLLRNTPSDSGFLYFEGQPGILHQPVKSTGFDQYLGSDDYANFSGRHLTGATFRSFVGFFIYSPDVPDSKSPIYFEHCEDKDLNWINVLANGVNAHISVYDKDRRDFPVELGDTSSIDYKDTCCAFNTFFSTPKNDPLKPFLEMGFVESAVYKSDITGFIAFGMPTNDSIRFKDMLFTSTAHNVGGKLDLSEPANLFYWGVRLVQRPGFDNAGLVCVKKGQVILSACGLLEKRHFFMPFYLTWGEMYASGKMGNLFFDYNTGGQTFDGFKFTHQKVALSEYTLDVENGFLRAAGYVYFPFFGPNYFSINDWKEPKLSNIPFEGRRVELSDDWQYECSPSDLNIHGTWMDDFGYFNYDLEYSSIDQNGFEGDGQSRLKYLDEDIMASKITLKWDAQCFSIDDPVDSKHQMSFGPLLNFGYSANTWGCGCIDEDQLKYMVIGGEIAVETNVSIAARAAGGLTYTLQLAPELSNLNVDGLAYISIITDLDAEVNGHLTLIIDQNKDFVEGDITGRIKLVTSFTATPPFNAYGRIEWHLGANYQLAQGKLSVELLGVSAEGGLFLGVGAPADRAWILTSNDKYGIPRDGLTDSLSGIYAYILFGQNLNIGIFSGGYEVYGGMGVFGGTGISGSIKDDNDNYTFYMVGSLGGRIYGEILWGLVSASAFLNLAFSVPYPASFQGRVGLEGCLLWVACRKIYLTVGMNTSRGFYIN